MPTRFLPEDSGEVLGLLRGLQGDEVGARVDLLAVTSRVLVRLVDGRKDAIAGRHVLPSTKPFWTRG